MSRPSDQAVLSVALSAEDKQMLQRIAQTRGMTIKALLGRLIQWFVACDLTEQAVILGQIERRDVRSLAEMVLRRAAGGPAAPAGEKARAVSDHEADADYLLTGRRPAARRRKGRPA